MQRLAAISCALLIGLLAPGCRSSSPDKVSNDTTAASGAISPICFAATSPAGHTATLFGTMHSGVATDDLPAWVWARLNAAPTFAMETDPGEAMGLVALLMRTDGSTLETELGPVYWRKLEAALGKESAAAMRPLKAAAAAAQLEAQGLPSTEAMDLVLHDAAFNANKRVAYMERPELQLQILDQVMNVDALKEMLDDPGASARDTQQLLAAYRRGDIAAIDGLVANERARSLASGKSAADLDRDDALLLGGRNASWIPVIDGLVATGDAFVAVGAMHLIGKGSVPELLAAKGYTVQRVMGPGVPPAAAP